MKPSRYTRLIRYDGGGAFLFSTLFKTLVRLDEEGERFWLAGDHDKIFDHPRLKGLRTKFMVGSEVEEFPRAFHLLTTPPGLPKTLYATVVVTMQCNMGCIYCHESGRLDGVRMDRATAEKTGRFLIGIARRAGYERIVLYFYGGEPLMNLSAVETVAGVIENALPGASKVFIPTNGLLIDDDCLEIIRKTARNVHLQITLDGPRAVHDSRRPRRDGRRSSYDRLLTAVKMAAGYFRVTVRTNIDKDNIGCVENLLDDLIRVKLLPSAIGWYASPVAKIIEGDPEINDRAFSLSEWAEAAESVWRAQAARKIDTAAAVLGDGLCGIRRKASLTVNCRGGIYPCTGLHSRAGKAPGTIDDMRVPWPPRSWRDIPEKCARCPYFPYCGGGCHAQSQACHSRPECPVAYFERILPVYLRYRYGLCQGLGKK